MKIRIKPEKLVWLGLSVLAFGAASQIVTDPVAGIARPAPVNARAGPGTTAASSATAIVNGLKNPNQGQSR